MAQSLTHQTVSVGTVSVGTINTGTINSDTIVEGTLRNLISGTINAATAVLNSGTINVATAVITTLPNLPDGTLSSSGTTTGVGTVSGVGTMSNLGTIEILRSGTVTVLRGGTLNNIIGGTITALANGTIGAGTLTALANGTVSAGTINTSTVNAGTINIGTVVGPILEVIGTQTAGTQDVIASTDLLGYRSMSVQLINTWVGTVNIQASNDGTNWQNLNVTAITSLTFNSPTINTPNIYNASVNFRYVRVRTAAWTSGTVNAYLEAFAFPSVPNTLQVLANQQSTWNVGSISAGTAVLNSGTINVATAVISTLPNLPQGSINVTAGTVRSDARTTQDIVSFGTQVGASGATAATIVGSASIGAGTHMWVNDFSIINPNGSVLCVLGIGTAQQGTNVLFRGVLGTQTGVGIEKSYAKAVDLGMVNGDLVLSLGAAGTVDLSISYLISA